MPETVTQQGKTEMSLLRERKTSCYMEMIHNILNYRITVDFFEHYRNTVIKFLSKYRHRSISIRNCIFPSLLGDWNTEYSPFFIQITVSPTKKLANTEYLHIVCPLPPNIGQGITFDNKIPGFLGE